MLNEDRKLTDGGNSKSTGAPTASEWSEQGFHWERATAWGPAMTCYYEVAMQLHAQGGTDASKASFSLAFRMMDMMRQEAGVHSLAQNHHPEARSPSAKGARPPCDWERIVALLSQQSTSETDMAALMEENLEYILSGRSVVLCVTELHRMFEQSSELLYTGLSVMVRLAQTMLHPEPTDLSCFLFENALDMVYVLKTNKEALADVDGGVFGLRKFDICFQIYSGMFFLLLNDYVSIGVRRIERMVAVVLRAINHLPGVRGASGDGSGQQAAAHGELSVAGPAAGSADCRLYRGDTAFVPAQPAQPAAYPLLQLRSCC